MTKRKTPPVPLEKGQTGGRKRHLIDKKVLKALAAIGCNYEEIVAGLVAAGCTICHKTIKRRLAEEEFRTIYDQGQNEFRIGLRRQQAAHAKLPNSAGVQMTIHLSKHFLGQTDKSAVELTGKNGGPITAVDLSKLSNEQLTALETVFGPLTEASGDDAGDQGGESPAES